jgi:hypothetical protein
MKINIKKMLPAIILGIIVVFAFVLRVYRVDQVPPSLYWDEAAMALDAKYIVETGKDQHGNNWLQTIFPSWGDYKLPGYIIAAVPFFRLMPNNLELALRLVSVLAGTTLVLVGYFLSLELFGNSKKGKNIALFTAGLLTLLPVNRHFSRVGIEGNLALTFNALFLLFFLKSRQKTIWFIPSWLFLVFGFFTYFSARYYLPLLAINAFIFLFKKYKQKFLLLLGSLLLIGACFYLTGRDIRTKQADFIRFSTKSIFNNTEPIEKSILLQENSQSPLRKWLYHRYIFQAQDLLFHISKHIDLSFLVTNYDGNLRHSSSKSGALYFALIPFFFIGLYFLWNNNKKMLMFLVVSYFVAVLPAAATYEVPHILRSLNLTLFLAIITAFGLSHFFYSNSKYKFFKIGLVILFIWQFIIYTHDYFTHYSARSFSQWQYGYKQAVEKASQDYDSSDKIYLSNQYGRVYLYLLLYGNSELRGYFQDYRLRVDDKNNYAEPSSIGKVVLSEPADIDSVLLSDEKITAIFPYEEGMDITYDHEIIIGPDNKPLLIYAKNY